MVRRLILFVYPQALLRQCMGDAQKLFGFNPDGETDIEGQDRESSSIGASAVTASNENLEVKVS